MVSPKRHLDPTGGNEASLQGTIDTIDVDDDDLDIEELSPMLTSDVFFDEAVGGGLTNSPTLWRSCSPAFMPDSAAANQRSSSPVLQEDAFPTYTVTSTVAPTVLADLPGSFEIRRNTRASPSMHASPQQVGAHLAI